MGQGESQSRDADLELCSIQDLYRSFIVECPSGSLHLHEFKRMFGVKYGTVEAQYMETLFKAFDMNHDNTMDFMEYVAALHLVLRGRLEDKLRWSFKVFDNDDNGYLDKQEISKIIRIIYKIKKGSSTEKNDLENMSPEEISDRIFKEVDVNGDGEITLEEFLEGAKKSPWLQNFLRLDINPSGYVQQHMEERRLSLYQ